MSIKTEFSYQEDGGKGFYLVNRVQDAEFEVELAKDLAKDAKTSDWGRLIGLIPLVILEKWINDDGANYLAMPEREFALIIKRKLRDPDYAWLRTYSGNI
jgi:hypothetical protein